MSKTRRSVAVAAALATLSVGAAVLVAPSASAHPSERSERVPARGSVVLVGGNLAENAEIIGEIVRLADPDGSGPRRARIALVTAAAPAASTAAAAADPSLNNAAANGLYYAELFARFGADTYAVPIDGRVNYVGDAYVPANADSAEVAAQVASSTGVFFGGGDQMRYVRTLFHCADAPDEAYTDCTDSAVLTAVRSVVDRGGVVAGVSAGTTIQQGRTMVTGGESYQAWRDGSRPGYLDDPAELAYVPSGGFGFFTEGLVDSHFTTWGRQARAVRLALDVDAPRIVGVDETTALVYDRRTRQARVVGVHGVSILDVRGAVETAPSSVRGVRWTYLTAGDRIDFRDGDVRRAAGSSAVVRDGAAPTEIQDGWDSIDGPGGVYSLRDLARTLVRSTAPTATALTFETGPQFRTTLVQRPSTRAWVAGGVSFEGLELRIDAA